MLKHTYTSSRSRSNVDNYKNYLLSSMEETKMPFKDWCFLQKKERDQRR